MNVRVEDLSVLGALRPLDVAAYLRSRGWTEIPDDSAMVTWEREVNGQVVDILVPVNQHWRDYPRRMRSVVDTLGDIEQRSQLAIVHDITAVFFDIVRLRSADPAIINGTILLEDIVHIVAAGRGMMLSAACASIQTRRAYHTRKPVKATRFVDGLRMGQTEHGSYVLSIMSPVSPALGSKQQMSLPMTEIQQEPYERTVTRTLGAALGKLHGAASRSVSTGEIDAFEEAVAVGVSADLCEAVGMVRECAYVSTFEISIGWAPARPLGSGPQTFTFATDVLDIVREAGRVLRERAPVEDFELLGTVVDLSRPTGDLHGVATILGSVDGKLRKVSTELHGADWQTAHNAQEKTPRVWLRCTGDLVKSGNNFVLERAHDVAEVQP